MSKELEALKNIANEISNYKLHGIGNENWLGIQDVMQDIDIIENALERNIDKKPIKVEQNHYVCPSCKETVFIFNEDNMWKNSVIWNKTFNVYCKCCGQKLDWDLEGEKDVKEI